MTPFPTQEPDAGATNMPNPNPSANSSGRDGSGGLRAEMAAVAHSPSRCLLGVDPIEQVTSPFQAVELAVTALFNAGYRLVSVDDDTVERVARMVHDHDCDAAEDGPCQQYELHRKWHISTARFAVLAAVQALRDGSGT